MTFEMKYKSLTTSPLYRMFHELISFFETIYHTISYNVYFSIFALDRKLRNINKVNYKIYEY